MSNYHDALLPKYGGVNATSWAIINQEEIHGITWHVIDKKVDAGDILKQASFYLTNNETALSLNAKCFEAANQSFKELVFDLSTDNIKRTHQDQRQRTFFPRSKQPSIANTLDFSLPSDQLDAFVRSMDFGIFPNLFGVPKLLIDEEFLIIGNLVDRNSPSTLPPGTILKWNDDSIHITTASNDVEISHISDIDGNSMRISELIEKFNIQPGYQLPKLDPEWSADISAYHRETYKKEAFWVKQLRDLKPIQLPYANQKKLENYAALFKMKFLKIPGVESILFEDSQSDQELVNFIFSAFVVYLARLSDLYVFDFGFQDSILYHSILDQKLDQLFSSYVPLKVSIGANQKFSEIFTSLEAQIMICLQHKTYARDIHVRYPELRAENEGKQELTVLLAIVDDDQDIESYQAPSGFDLIFVVQKPNDFNQEIKTLWIYDSNSIEDGNLIRMQEQFLTLYNAIQKETDKNIQYFSIVPEEERHKILVDWNSPKVEYPNEKCIHELIEAQAEKTPDNVAAIFETEHLTYKELDLRSNQLAHFLRKKRVGPEVFVGIYLECSLDMLVGLLGILKAGGVYVPLNIDDPKERLSFVFDDSQMKVLLTQQSLENRLPPTNVEVVCLDSERNNLSAEAFEHCTGCIFR